MDYFEYQRHWKEHVELSIKQDQASRRVQALEKEMAIGPSDTLYEALQEAKEEYQEATKALEAHDRPGREPTVLKTPYGGFHPHFPENQK